MGPCFERANRDVKLRQARSEQARYGNYWDNLNPNSQNLKSSSIVNKVKNSSEWGRTQAVIPHSPLKVLRIQRRPRLQCPRSDDDDDNPI